MPRADLRWWWVLGALVLASVSVARADVAPTHCEPEKIERYLGERCVVCETSEFEPERCRRHFAGTGLHQRCSGVTTVDITGGWGELWCLPRGSTDLLPAAPPPIVRVDEPGGPHNVPAIPSGFRDPPPLTPAADSSSLPTDLDPAAAPVPTHTPPAAPEPAAPSPAAPTTTPKNACGGCGVGAPAWTLLVVAFARRRRRAAASER